jgi:methylene-tetrahydromethanopterin dehydrogenase
MAKNILHMMTPLAHMSPFDVNMAIDAGYDATASYTNVSLGEITDLIQDAMFSRSPRDAVRTGVFIGGKDALLALDMLDAAGKALFKPFEISLFADPAGSFTTAAAMIAVVEKTLKEKKDRALRGAAVSVFGATGVVGTASGVIAALEGATVTFVGRDGTDRTARHASEVNRRFGVNIVVAGGSTREARAAILAATEVVLCTAKAGVRVLDAGEIAGEIAGAAKLLVAADVNAVPPSGIEGVDAHANGTPLGERGALAVGALAIGNVKYRTESGLFKQMTESKTPLRLDFRQAFDLARTLA